MDAQNEAYKFEKKIEWKYWGLSAFFKIAFKSKEVPEKSAVELVPNLWESSDSKLQDDYSFFMKYAVSFNGEE